mgnify:CR=1 FL=1
MASTSVKQRLYADRFVSDKERAFVSEYLKDWNATQAAVRAGYAKKGASNTAWTLLQRAHVQQAIGALTKAKLDKYEVDPQEILYHLICCVTRRRSDFEYPLGHERQGQLKDHWDINDRADCAVDAIEQEVLWETIKKNEDDDGTTTTKLVKTKLKIVPKATAMDMAMKHKGLYAALEVSVGEAQGKPDWGDLWNTADDCEDIIETRIREVETRGKEKA